MSKWFKLDNAAKIYPPVQTKKWAPMYRISVNLTEPVNPDVLYTAQCNALKRFPSFGCRLRRGLFWYFLEHMEHSAPPIYEDVYNPLQRMDYKKNNHFMFRLLYRKNRIALECFHAVADGFGGMTFLLSIVNEYIRLMHGVCAAPGGYILSCSDEPDPEEYEDSFLRYAQKNTISRSEEKSYRTGGTPVPFNRLLIISGTASSYELRAKAKEYGVNVGVFLSAVLLYAVHTVQQNESSAHKRRMIAKISVPINLRTYFPSKTLRNFSSYINPGVDGSLGRHSFEEVLNLISHYMGMHINRRELNAWFSENVATEINPVIRAVPLFIKKPIMRLVFALQGDRYNASNMSNMGLVKLPPELERYVSRIDCVFGGAPTRRTLCACVSYGGKTVLNFSRTALETDVEREFFTFLVKQGIHIKIESNGRG